MRAGLSVGRMLTGDPSANGIRQHQWFGSFHQRLESSCAAFAPFRPAVADRKNRAGRTGAQLSRCNGCLTPKIAIVAALERELHPLVKNWPRTTVEHAGRQFTFYESGYAIAVCAGIGHEAGRRAAQAMIVEYAPEVIISAGVAGALVPELKVGETIFPAVVVDTQDGSRRETAIRTSPVSTTALGRTIVASSPEIARIPQKERLAKAYGAHAVDMESAAVARAAEAHNLPFLAIKSISDEYDFDLPDMEKFIANSEFATTRFVLHVAVRPWLWLPVMRLARNTRIASENLCAWLRESVLTNTIVRGIVKPDPC